MKPYIVSRVVAPNGSVIFQNSPVEIRRVVSPEVAQTLTGLFVDVVEHGTGAPARVNDLLMAGKTGTAQNPHGKDHSWFICFAPYDNPKIAICVLVENAGWGAAVAAPIAQRIVLKYLFGNADETDIDDTKYKIPD